VTYTVNIQEYLRHNKLEQEATYLKLKLTKMRYTQDCWKYFFSE